LPTMLPTPPPHCQCRRCAAATAASLPPPACCLCHSANAATVLLPPPPRCHCRCPSAAAVTVLPLPPLHCRRCCRRCRCPAAPPPTAAKLPPPHPMPPLRCLHRPCTANAAASLPTIATPLPRCLRRSADAATAHLMLPPRFLLPSLCCRRRHRSTAAIAATLSPCFPTAH
jgi:hypothetical protein